MKRTFAGVASAALTLTAFAPVAYIGLASAPAHAESPSEKQCIADGGEFYRDGGYVVCIIESTVHVGNSDNSQTTTNTDTEGSNGTLNNNPKHQETDDCSGPGNSDDKSDHC